jgi:hypothetical protein
MYTSLYVNKKVICQSDQFYGTKRAFFEQPGIANLNVEQKSAPGGHAGMNMGGAQPSHEVMSNMPSQQTNNWQQASGQWPGAPSVPQNVQTSPNGQQSGQIAWQQPTNSGQPPKAAYAEPDSIYLTVPIQYDDEGEINGPIKMPADRVVESVQRNTPGPQDPSPLAHVSESSSCINFGVLHVGDNIEVGATYNTTAHTQNMNLMHEHGGGLLSWIGLGSEPKYA